MNKLAGKSMAFAKVGWHGLNAARLWRSEPSQRPSMRGHDATYFEIVPPHQAKKPEGKRKRQMLHICRSCLTYSGLELWARKCTKRQCRKIMPSLKFWKGMAKTDDIDAIMDKLNIPLEKRKLIHEEVAKE